MGNESSLAPIEEDVPALHCGRLHWRHGDQFSVFNRRLHAGAYGPEPDAIPTAQQLTSDLVKHREGGAAHDPHTSATTRSAGVNERSWHGTALATWAIKPSVTASA